MAPRTRRLPADPADRELCPLCGSGQLERRYERSVGRLSLLGSVCMRLDLCTGCGLLFQNPPPSPEILDEHYRSSKAASSTIWHETASNSVRGRLVAERKRFLERLIGMSSTSASLLDVGCAWGELLAALELPGWRRVGLEPNPQAVERARCRGIETVQATLEKNELPDSSFGLVSCVSCLEHVGKIRASMAALERLVEPDGLLFIEVPDSRRPIAQIAEFYSIEHLTHFTQGTLWRLLVECGFEPILSQRPSGPTLRVGARKVGPEAARSRVRFRDDRVELEAALRRYSEERADLERSLLASLGMLADRWGREAARIAIYGAGEHTRFLLELIDVERSVVAILDSDPAKHGSSFLRWPVHAPEDLPTLGVDAVLVSSQPFQEEMVARIAAPAQAAGIEIVRCYPADPKVPGSEGREQCA